MAAERSTDGGADGGDLVLGLKGLHAEALEAGELMEDIAGGCDRVAAVEEGPPGELTGGEEAEGGRLVAGDVAVEAGVELRLGHVIVLGEHLRRLAKVIASLQCRDVGLGGLRIAPAVVLLVELDRRFEGPAVHPEHEAEGEHVLGAVDFLGGEVHFAQGAGVEGTDGNAEDAVSLKAAVFERVAGVASFLEVGIGVLVLVHDEDAAAGQVRQVDFEGGRVHDDEGVRRVARRVDVEAGEADLEGADAGQGPLRGTDLGWEIGDGADVVAEDSGGLRELAAGNLHAVAGVAGESDRYAVEVGDRWVAGVFGKGCHLIHPPA